MLFRSAFTPLLIAHFLTFLNSNFLKNALILLVLSQLSEIDGAAMSAFVSATFMLPMIFLSGIGGQLADMCDKRNLGRTLKCAELMGVSVAVAGIVVSNFWLVLAGLVLLQVVSALFAPVRGSLIPDLAGKDNVHLENAWIEAGSFAAMVLGIWIVGIAFSYEEGVRTTLALVVLLCSAIGFVAINFIPLQEKRAPAKTHGFNFVRGTWSALSIAASDATRLSAFTLAWGWFVASLVLSTAPAIVKNLGGGASDISKGMMCYGLLGVIGAQIIAHVAKKSATQIQSNMRAARAWDSRVWTWIGRCS